MMEQNKKRVYWVITVVILCLLGTIFSLLMAYPSVGNTESHVSTKIAFYTLYLFMACITGTVMLNRKYLPRVYLLFFGPYLLFFAYISLAYLIALFG
jgi:hypothetical protein